jgi:hypothetical protein
MPRTIRKRQLRNKKSRKQRGGLDQNQINKIKSIQTTISDSIKELLSVLGESDPQEQVINDEINKIVNLKEKIKPESNPQQQVSNDEINKIVNFKETIKPEAISNQTISTNTVVGV